MGANSLREIIATEIRSAGRANSYNKALFILGALRREGYVILSPDEAEQVAELKAELDLLQDVIDSRPAINAALPDSYIRWSQAIYSGDAIRSLKGGRDAQ